LILFSFIAPPQDDLLASQTEDLKGIPLVLFGEVLQGYIDLGMKVGKFDRINAGELVFRRFFSPNGF